MITHPKYLTMSTFVYKTRLYIFRSPVVLEVKKQGEDNYSFQNDNLTINVQAPTYKSAMFSAHVCFDGLWRKIVDRKEDLLDPVDIQVRSILLSMVDVQQSLL